MRVLFVCAGNICRSPLAERLLWQSPARSALIGLEVASAGLDATPGEEPIAESVRAARRLGVDLVGHRARRLDPKTLSGDELVLVMERGQRERIEAARAVAPGKVHLLGRFARGPEEIGDPEGGDDSVFDACFTRIRACVEGVLATLV